MSPWSAEGPGLARAVREAAQAGREARSAELPITAALRLFIDSEEDWDGTFERREESFITFNMNFAGDASICVMIESEEAFPQPPVTLSTNEATARARSEGSDA
jgi:hypothetical protein